MKKKHAGAGATDKQRCAYSACMRSPEWSKGTMKEEEVTRGRGKKGGQDGI